MIKLPRRPSTTWTETGACDRRHYIIKWGQEFPRVLLESGNASGNEFEYTTTKLRANPGFVESNCSGTALVRPTSETILAS
jgi:hypothetical protein